MSIYFPIKFQMGMCPPNSEIKVYTNEPAPLPSLHLGRHLWQLWSSKLSKYFLRIFSRNNNINAALFVVWYHYIMSIWICTTENLRVFNLLPELLGPTTNTWKWYFLLRTFNQYTSINDMNYNFDTHIHACTVKASESAGSKILHRLH